MSTPSESAPVSRRSFLSTASTGILSGSLLSAGVLSTSCSRSVAGNVQAASGAVPAVPLKPVVLPSMLAATEQERSGPPPLLRPAERIGYAVVGLGTLSLTQILPAIVRCQKSRLVAVVSGSRDKAETVAQQYGLPTTAIYDYAGFDRIAENPDIQVVYIVLPNGMHAEFTIRAARAGKHVLCEKPMANSAAECERMITACAEARRKLMVAYRLQYEPHHRELIRLARKELGTLKFITAENGQNLGDPKQWRLNKALAGGGSLADVGIYCLNAARYLTGEEPDEVTARIHSTSDDSRFREVEENIAFQLHFPSGVLATATSGYGHHERRHLTVIGTDGWAEMDNAFTYGGLALRSARAQGKQELVTGHYVEERNHFATEMDHFSDCILKDRAPRTGGQEGLQDLRLIEALYRSAASGGASVHLAGRSGKDATRGPELDEEEG